MTINSTQQTQIIQLTVGMFNAAPGAVYMNDFADYVSGGGSIQGLANALAATSTFQSASFYPTFLTSNEFATNFIDSLVGGTVGAANKSWAVDQVVDKLAAGESRGDAMHWAITALADVPTSDANWGAAATQFANKVTVASYYTFTANGAVTDVSTLQAAIASVTNDPATVTAAIANIDSGTISGAGGGLTIALTTGLDAFTAGTGNDGIDAGLGALQNGDVIDGGPGIDTLTIRDASGAGLARIRNIERINLVSLGTARLNLADATGYTSLNVWGTGNSATIENVASGLNLTIGVVSGFGGDLTIGFQDEANANDVLRLYVNNASGFVLNESAHAIETINIQAAGSGIEVHANYLPSGLSTIDVTGTAGAILDIDRSESTAGLAVNASALQGTLVLTLNSRLAAGLYSAGEVAVNLGSGHTGASVIQVSTTALGTFGSALRVNGGAGFDDLKIVVVTAGTRVPSAIDIERVDIIANTAAAGQVAGADFASLAASLAAIAIQGDASAAELLNLTAGATVEVAAFTGNLAAGLVSETGAADVITFKPVSGSSAAQFRFHETAHAIETINLVVDDTAYAASASEFGTATKAFNIQGEQNVTMHLLANSASTALTISSTALTAGDLNLTIDAIGGNQQLDVRLGTGNDVLALASGVFRDNMTAVIDAGLGSDSFSMVVETTAALAPTLRGFEAVTLAFDNPRGTFNASGVSGATTLEVLLGSGSGSSVNVTNLPGEVSTLSVGVVTGSAVASARVDVSLVEDSSDLTLRVDASRASAATALFGTIGVTGIRGLILQPGGSGNVQLNDLYADDAPRLAIDMLASSVDLTLSALCAGGASSVVINATAGDFQAIALGFGTAREVTINQAGSHDYSGVHINNLYAPLGEIAITVAGASGSSVTAGVIIDTATVGDHATITTLGGDVRIGDLRMAASSLGSNATGNVRLTLAANGSADYILIGSLGVGTGGTAYSGGHNLIVTISGSGDVTLGSVVAWTGNNASNGAENVISAAALHGTLVFGASAASAGLNYSISLGDDQASANSVAVGRGNDSINGGGNRDTIEGGDGEDTLRGGGGSDVFAFLSSAGNFADARSGQKDFILDFASGDQIVFSGIRQLTSDAGYTSLSGLGDVSAISTATLIGTTVKSAVMAIYQASGNVYIEVALQTQAVANDDGVMTIVLDGSRWTALSSVINVSVGESGLYIVHL